MNLSKKLKIVKWVNRIFAILVLAFALPFYFGYGNPLPLIDTSYTLWDNVWLTIFPFVFLGLFIGLRYEKIGGYLVVIPLTVGIIFGIVVSKELIWFMLIPEIIGLIYLTLGYKKIN